MKQERGGIASVVHEALGAGFLLLLGGCPLKVSSRTTTVMCLVENKKDQAAIWFEAFITWTGDSFLDSGCAVTQVFFLVELGRIACSG